MKIIKILCLVSFLLLTACTGENDKFLGEWEFSEYSPTLFGLNFLITENKIDSADYDIVITIKTNTNSKKRHGFGRLMVDRYNHSFVRVFSESQAYGDLYFNKNNNKLELISNFRNYPMVELRHVDLK